MSFLLILAAWILCSVAAALGIAWVMSRLDSVGDCDGYDEGFNEGFDAGWNEAVDYHGFKE